MWEEQPAGRGLSLVDPGSEFETDKKYLWWVRPNSELEAANKDLGRWVQDPSCGQPRVNKGVVSTFVSHPWL